MQVGVIFRNLDIHRRATSNRGVIYKIMETRVWKVLGWQGYIHLTFRGLDNMDASSHLRDKRSALFAGLKSPTDF